MRFREEVGVREKVGEEAGERVGGYFGVRVGE